VGLTWFPTRSGSTPLEDATGTFASPDADDAGARDAEPDAWGVEPARERSINVAGATGFVAPWTWSTFVHDKAWSYVSPRSWWRGVSAGFSWDDNHFHVNHLRHPYHGNLYFNAARSNGFRYWTGVLYAMVGSYIWECCIETHIASTSDMITTTLGGAAVGEATYRTSSLALDNSVGGPERVLREALGTALAPSRGITRLLTGRAWRRSANPSDRRDHVPDSLAAFFLSGVRRVDRGDPAEGSTVLPFFELEIDSGDLFGRQSRPFDYYRGHVRINPREKHLLGELRVRGSLWGSTPRGSPGHESRLFIFQDLEYVNTRAYSYAAQSLTGAWLRRAPATARVAILLNAEASLTILGAVNSEYAAFAEIRGFRERDRLYDFGFGPAASVALTLVRDGRRWIEAEYKTQYLSTLNGSNVQGSSSRHLLQFVDLRVHHSLARQVGLGFDLQLFTQDSDYGYFDFEDSYERHSRLRLFLTWSPDLR